MKMKMIPVLALGAAAGLLACSSSDDSSGTSSGGAVDSGTASLSLYDRLGGKSGLETFVANEVNTHILTDADLKTFFFNQVAMPIPAGHPSAKQITVCFARFVGAALKSDTYPGDPVPDATNTNTPMHTCRDMVSAHRSASTMLNIGDGNFDKFISYIAADLMTLVKPTATQAGEITMDEYNALAAALTGQKEAVTTPGANSTGPFHAP